MAKGLGSNSSKKEKMEISTPYDPVHLTHVGFNYHTGEFTVRNPNRIMLTGVIGSSSRMAKAIGEQWCLSKGTGTESTGRHGHRGILL
jgi:P21-Rho-binding domain